MARSQNFDRDTVIRAARTVFWKVGYENASIPDLEDATGLSRSSIYNTFGSKRGLFDAAVQSYLDEIIRPRLRPLTADAVAPNALTDYLTGLRGAFQRLDSMAATSGCLLINAAGSPIADDAEVARVITGYRAELQGAVVRGVQARDADLDTIESLRLGEVITGLVVAAFALARIDPAHAAHNLTTALELIDERGAVASDRHASSDIVTGE